MVNDKAAVSEWEAPQVASAGVGLLEVPVSLECDAACFQNCFASFLICALKTIDFCAQAIFWLLWEVQIDLVLCAQR